MEELTNAPQITEAYGLWYNLREEVLQTYKDTMPERLPLFQHQAGQEPGHATSKQICKKY